MLVVHPADKFEDPLRCSIVHYVLSAEISSDDYCSRQHHSAVSYTWGSALSTHQLLVAGPLAPGNSVDVSAHRYLRITANVDSLLRHLRKAHKAVRLWIDAVCLNQTDEKEKAQQIHKMGDIYRAAKKVHIWLGDDNVDDARRVFSLIRQVELRNEWSPSQDEVSLLAKLFARAWFARLWVIQEAVLAHEAVLRCGSDSLALSWMLLALKKAQSSTAGLEVLGYGPKMLLSSVAKYQEAPDRCSMLDLLWDLHLSECSDPRDRIAALYGLASSTSRQPDLRYNEGAAQVYWDCASYFINRDPVSAHMLILQLAGFGSLRAIPQAGEPPSWVPDWSRSRRPVLQSLDALQNTVKSLEEANDEFSTSHYMSQKPTPRDVSDQQFRDFVDYCITFKHATQMRARGNSLQICSHPLIFHEYIKVVEEVYRCESSDWKDVWLLFSQILINHNIVDDLDVKRRIFRDFKIQPDVLDGGAWETFTDHISYRLGLSQENIERFEELGSILSRFSLIRTSPYWESKLCYWHLGPRDAAVGDFLVPFIIPEKPPFSTWGDYRKDWWAASICLRPTLTAGTKTCVERDNPAVPFCRTVRWLGLSFHKHRQTIPSFEFLSVGKEQYEPLCLAYYKALEKGLPGPYVFDVI